MAASSPSPRKTRAFDALLAQVQEQLDETTASQKASVEGATHEESRAENDKDTRGLETTYLARGLAKRVVELRQAKAALVSLNVGPSVRVSAGALVVVADEDGVEKTFLMAPAGGGMNVDVDGPIAVITPQSPLGKGLMGREVGDEATLRLPKGKQEVEIVDVQ